MLLLSLTQSIGKKFTSLLRHDSTLETEMYSNGSVEMRRLFDCLGKNVHPWRQFIDVRLFASFSNGNNKQRFFVEVVLRERWVLDENPLAWIIYIGCNQGPSTRVSPDKLSAVEMYSLGWIFRVRDSRHENSLYDHGLRRYSVIPFISCMKMMVV